MKKRIIAIAMALCATSSFSQLPAYTPCNAQGHVKIIYWVNNLEFRVQMADVPLNPPNPDRWWTVRSATSGVGTEGLRMLHSQLTTAIATGHAVWLGTRDLDPNTPGCQESWDVASASLYNVN